MSKTSVSKIFVLAAAFLIYVILAIVVAKAIVEIIPFYNGIYSESLMSSFFSSWFPTTGWSAIVALRYLDRVGSWDKTKCYDDLPTLRHDAFSLTKLSLYTTSVFHGLYLIAYINEFSIEKMMQAGASAAVCASLPPLFYTAFLLSVAQVWQRRGAS